MMALLTALASMAGGSFLVGAMETFVVAGKAKRLTMLVLFVRRLLKSKVSEEELKKMDDRQMRVILSEIVDEEVDSEKV